MRGRSLQVGQRRALVACCSCVQLLRADRCVAACDGVCDLNRMQKSRSMLSRRAASSWGWCVANYASMLTAADMHLLTVAADVVVVACR
jgi:hypothetical protein